MTGTHTQNPIYSRITMALMEDTGWYLPNYNMADDFKWGRNLGCDFTFASCLEWMETRQKRGQSIHPFCNKVKRDPLETECTDDRSSVALCNLVQHDNLLPAKFQVSFKYLYHYFYIYIYWFRLTYQFKLTYRFRLIYVDTLLTWYMTYEL